MPKGSPRATADPLATGWAHLADARWKAARTAFGDALAADESADAHEGLSWAAWWLDDEPAVFAAREQAYRLYRRAGDHAGAARMATWLAADHLDFHGAISVARGWLRRAERELDRSEPGPEHGWHAFHDGYIARLTGDSDRAAELAERAARIGREHSVSDLEMLGLALEGTVHITRAEVDAGMRCLDEAMAATLADEAEIPISGAWACCFLVSSCAAVRDFERASEWCDRIAEFAERYGSRYMLAFCRGEYGEIKLWQGAWEEAEELLEAAIDDFERSRPGLSGGTVVQLAELKRRQGRRDEARELLEPVAGSPAAMLCGARLALDDGDAKRAADGAERVLRQVPDERQLERVPALELLAAAHAARGELDDAGAAIEELRAIEARVGTVAMRACVDAAAGTVTAAKGDHEGARVLLEDAIDSFERIGAPFHACQSRISLATCLSALGHDDAARDEAEAAAGRLSALGAKEEAERAAHVLDEGGPAGQAESIVTKREREVLRLIAEGMTNRQIAERLIVSEHTVHRHVTNILRKLDLSSRTAAAAWALRSGLIGPDE